MSHEGQEQKLVYMADQIATFFASEPDETAIAAIEDHLRKFWDPRMRSKIVAYTETSAHGLSERAYAAVRKLAKTAPSTL